MRRNRNCDSFTNPDLIVKGVGLVKTCPRALPSGAYTAFHWWHGWKEYKALPFPDFGFSSQPAFVCQAIRAGDMAYVEASRSS